MSRLKLAILDDYLDCALDLADWSAVRERADITVFTEAFASEDAAAAALAGFDILCLMRDRTPFPASLIARLPRLRFLTHTGSVNIALDLAAATARGIPVSNTATRNGLNEHAEFVWALIMATARSIPANDAGMRAGKWQARMSTALHGQTIGILGLGNFGSRVAQFAKVFGMEVLAWSANLTDEKAAEKGARRVELDELLAAADLVTIHLVLSDRTRGLIGARELGLMKRDAILINTSRGPIVDEAALLAALREERIAAAGLDVFAIEPLPADHPLRAEPRTVLSPHMGFVTRKLIADFYQQSIENILGWMDEAPIRLANPGVGQVL